jgi:DNA recombination protein RmuC
MVTLENLAYLGIGFCVGVLVCGILARSGILFFSKKLKTLSHEALFDNSTRFMEFADKYFSSYVKEAKKDFDIKGNDILRTIDNERKTQDH